MRSTIKPGRYESSEEAGTARQYLRDAGFRSIEVREQEVTAPGASQTRALTSFVHDPNAAALGMPERAARLEEDADILRGPDDHSALAAPASGPVPLLIARAAHDNRPVATPDRSGR